MRPARALLLLCLAAAVPAMLRAAGPSETEISAAGWTRLEFVEAHMGTLFQIVLFTEEGRTEAAQAAVRQAFGRVAELDARCTDYDPASELRQLTLRPSHQPLSVSADLFSLLQQSQDLSERTQGAFDVTVGPLVALWRQSRRTLRLPDAASLTAARARCGYRHLQLDPVHRTVTLGRADLLLDLGGIAKGYAADAALAVLRARGFDRALVAASGDLAIGDAPPGKTGWRVGASGQRRTDASPPLADEPPLILENAGVSTSGGSEQFVEIDGRRYAHLIDPRTGLGLTAPTSVTVIARRATLSDALATAACILPWTEAQALAENFPEPVRLIRHASGTRANP